MFSEHAKNCWTDVTGEGLLFNVTSETCHQGGEKQQTGVFVFFNHKTRMNKKWELSAFEKDILRLCKMCMGGKCSKL